MKNRKFVFAAVMAALVAMTGCGNKEQQTTAETATVQETVTEETTQEETTTEEKEKETEKDTEVSSLKKLFGKADSAEEDEIDEVFSNSDERTGYLGATSKEITKNLEACGITVDDLSRINMLYYEDEDAIFHFVMYNEDSLQAVDTGYGKSFMTQLVYDEEEFYVLFGSDEAVEYEEALVYCEEGTMVEYWAVGSVEDDTYLLVPIVAGNEENGYYIVRTALESTGVDMSGTMSLVEQGIDFRTDSSAGSNPIKTELTGEEYIYLEITGTEGDAESLVVNYEITNTYPVDVYISDAVIELNGVDITDSTVAFFEAEAGKTMEDCFFIDGYELKSGDEIVISGMLTDNETMDDIGTIELPIALKRR